MTQADIDINERLKTVRSAEEKRQVLERRKWQERLVLLPLLVLMTIAFFLFGRVVVVGQSMMPTLKSGEALPILKAYRWLSPLQVGDVVVIKPSPDRGDGQELIKRVVFIQNARGDLPWPAVFKTITRGDLPALGVFTRRALLSRVPPGGIVVMGDNFDNSVDSRDFGPIFDRDILGKVMMRR
jgi:signal peptidase I